MSLTVLGINPGLKQVVGSRSLGRHDPSACIIKDGELLAAVEEERFTRNKWGLQRTGSLPTNSIQFVLAQADVTDVDIVAIGWDPSNFIEKSKLKAARASLPRSFDPEALFTNAVDVALWVRNFVADYTDIREEQIRNIIRSQLNDTFDDEFAGELVFVPHHRSHAASAHFCSGYDRQITISADGGGEHDCTVLWSDSLDRVREFTRPNSIGHFYSKGAEYLGYTEPSASRHAGKVMGLAPYGNYREDYADIFDRLVDIGDGGYDVSRFRSVDLADYFGVGHTFPDEFEQQHKDFAYHLQRTTEDIVTHVVQSFVEETGIHDISVAGGVFMNCKMNREIANLDCVDNLFIQPASNDAGVAIGAALDAYESVTGTQPIDEFSHVYLGTGYDNADIKTTLDGLKVSYQKVDDPPKKAAQLLADDQLIGWFQGRMEFGPRALGNRSILANPRSTAARDAVNKNVKNRAAWRPFAPSLLYESKDEYLVDGFESPYMIMTDSIREEKRDEVPGIVHVDGTARPQTVRREQNERYYELLKEFERITGTPVLLNTSFNVSGEPIVESPKQAIADFYSTGLDALFVGDYMLKK